MAYLILEIYRQLRIDMQLVVSFVSKFRNICFVIVYDFLEFYFVFWVYEHNLNRHNFNGEKSRVDNPLDIIPTMYYDTNC